MQHSIDPAITDRMQREWNDRAVEDANFYVAFGRRGQDSEEFFATAAEVVAGLEWEMKRGLPAPHARARRALEIGCGPGRLMRPLSRHFGEIHGVDVSNEMIARARTNLADVPHAHPHHASGADLAAFADESFDFVYSYAVFQHIPSRDVVFEYLREAIRVLKPGGLFRAQINGLPDSAAHYDTWSGVRIGAEEVKAFAGGHGVRILALEGVQTQYMWTTWRKPGGVSLAAAGAVRIRRITNAHSSEPTSPPRGPFASITVWIENLPETADLNTMQVFVDDKPGHLCYIGPREPDGLQQVNLVLPILHRTGLVPVALACDGVSLCEPRPFRIIRGGPLVPRILSVADGVNLLSGARITSGSIKVTTEEAEDVTSFEARLNGIPVTGIDTFCADPVPPRYEINFYVPPGLSGAVTLEMALGRRRFAPVILDISPAQVRKD